MNNTEDLRDALREQERYAPAETNILNDLNSRRGQRRRNPRWSLGLLAAAAVAAISVGVTALATGHTAIPATPSVVAPSTTSQPSISPTHVSQRSSAQQSAEQQAARNTSVESATTPIPLAVAPDPPVKRPDGTVASPGAFTSGTVTIGPNGCAFLKPEGLPGARPIPTIWPYGMTARSKAGLIQVVDSHGKIYTDSKSVLTSGAAAVSVRNSTDPCLANFTSAVSLIRTDGQ